jgi:hypothetical protein
MNAAIALIVLVGILAVYSFATVQADTKELEAKRGWRIKARPAGAFAYEEQRDGSCVGFTMDEITDYREPPHHLQIMCSTRWTEYPEWTHGRRNQILGRIRSELKEPDYVLKEA